ncbi:MAG: YggS family pyridoxal phosphate-dependent enzyme [Hyphomicrobiaceae bacterium]|jgi:pyridoxal phosphate enzyme (YggS family)|nr:YggS family pyridoxal phosphate-dependent enzyme [Hyphomicrobiaceae bacterium]MDX2449167.1 YggS family pyridoxal phosphate-dependent enzyme [Hyphomicrobiaceae bacterium]
MSDEHHSATEIPARLRLVIEEIALAAEGADRDPDETKLIAVSKTVPAAVIEEAIESGQRLFGENRVQEALGKWPALKELHADIELHLIGPLQSNKVREAVALFDVIETLDRPKLARALAEEMERQGTRPRLFVQVNTGEEPQKAGIAPEETASFIALCRDTFDLNIDGLMCIPPFDEEPAMHFALLAKLADELGIEELSMGMSGDFAKAVAFGATYVRVGSAIFGKRVLLD